MPANPTLNTYLQQTQRLLMDPVQSMFNLDDLKAFINTGRGQLAGEAECVRIQGTVATIIGQRNYAFSGINIGVQATTGAQGVFHVRRIMYVLAGGFQWVPTRPWEWFDLYMLNNPVPASGAPTTWAQYAQGILGNFYLDPLPDQVYSLSCDCVCYPQDLSTDLDVECIPYPWTDAIKYYAAYSAYMEAQRQDEAMKMRERYEHFVAQARRFSNPSVNRPQYEQAQDPTMIAKLGLRPVKEGQ